MTNQKHIIILGLLFFLLSSITKSQNLYPSVINIETEIDKKKITAKDLSSLLQVNESSSEIALKINAANIKTSNNSLDTLLAKLNNTFILFKGNFPIKNLSFEDSNNENEKEFSGVAQLTINGITQEQHYSCVVYNLSGSDGFSFNDTGYPLSINLYFEFEPEEYKLNMLYKPLENGIKVEVARGFINKLTLASQNLFNEKQN